MMTTKHILTKLNVFLLCLTAVLAYVVASSGFVSAQQASQCKDTSVIPANVRFEGKEYEHCRNLGGYAGSDTGRCDNGDRIPQTQVGDPSKVQSFCASRLGYSARSAGVNNPGSGSTTVDEPKFVKSDCNGSLNQVNNEDSSKDNDCGIIKYLVIFINALSAIVGVVVVIMIIAGGIQYSAASDNPQAAAAAKKRITNAVAAMVFFIFMFAFLNYIIPGGVL